MKTETPFISREVERVVSGTLVSDGAGVRLLRILTGEWQTRLDPFLMLDEFRSDDPNDYIAGFPDHPHRGFETITYLLAGQMRHEDNTGGKGLLSAGGVQWMTAGRGIIHSEFPEQENGLLHGFQFWLNLPARDKLCAPAYRDIPAGEIPSCRFPDGVTIKLIAGSLAGISGAVKKEATLPLLADVTLPAGGSLKADIPNGHNAFIFVYEGELSAGQRAQQVVCRQMAVLDNLPEARGIQLSSRNGAGVLIAAGLPLGEPIVQAGPFVMNTRAEIEDAFRDYRTGRLA